MAAETQGLGGDAEQTQPIAAINVTPFVDVVLVLLVIFMVTAPVLMKDILGIQLPKAAHGEQKAAQSFGVAVTEQGQILLNGQVTDESSLAIAVRDAAAKDPAFQVLISADKNSRHGDLVHVIDLIKGIGVSRFALQIQKQD